MNLYETKCHDPNCRFCGNKRTVFISSGRMAGKSYFNKFIRDFYKGTFVEKDKKAQQVIYDELAPITASEFSYIFDPKYYTKEKVNQMTHRNDRYSFTAPADLNIKEWHRTSANEFVRIVDMYNEHLLNVYKKLKRDAWKLKTDAITFANSLNDGNLSLEIQSLSEAAFLRTFIPQFPLIEKEVNRRGLGKTNREKVLDKMSGLY
jgi:hypothetical protein